MSGPRHSRSRSELDVTLDGRPLQTRELAAPHAGRVHAVESGAGRLVVDYAATVSGQAEPAGADELELLTYLQPSRYCESDRLASIAAAEFGGLAGKALLDGVSSWVGTRLDYVPGSSISTDGAVETLLAGRGVCRDYAHLTVGLLRALEVPARVAAVYAPGLSPMDFHAVAEAYVDGAWQVVDPTLLAPRDRMASDRHRPRRRRDRVPEQLRREPRARDDARVRELGWRAPRRRRRGAGHPPLTGQTVDAVGLRSGLRFLPVHGRSETQSEG